jgi:hypothetical protein
MGVYLVRGLECGRLDVRELFTQDREDNCVGQWFVVETSSRSGFSDCSDSLNIARMDNRRTRDQDVACDLVSYADFI